MRALAVGIWALVAASGSASAQAVDERKQSAGMTVGEAAVLTGILAGRKGDCDSALKALEPALADGSAQKLPPDVLAQGYEVAIGCKFIRKDTDGAYRLARDATETSAGSDPQWHLRLGIEMEERHDAAVATIEAMAQRRPSALNSFELRWMYFFERALKDGGKKDLRRRLLRVLASPGYAPSEPLATRDAFFQYYAELLFADGDRAGTAALVRQVTSPMILLELSFDARFRTMLPADLDLRAAVLRSLKEARAAMREHPRLLNPILLAATAQRQLGMPKEALATLETARKAGAAPQGYTDAEEQLNWWWDGLARTYAMLGRGGDAEAAFRSGAQADETGSLNVSQRINLAQLQLRLAKPKDTLATLEPFSARHMAVSPYGELEMRFARGCANALAGNAAGASADLAYAQSHEADHPQALADLLLCMGDMDGAAAAFIRRLDDPERRARALIQLSEFDAPPASLPADPVASKLPALKARADVAAAIRRAGGTRRIRLQPMEL